jgi:molecular chaperone HtpG
MGTTTEFRNFQAETKALLHLMAHSLYSDRELFLREVISNASDALDRLRFESLINSDVLEGNNKFEIRLDVDRTARTLTISDTGIGMTRDEVIANIGTIAKSGTAEFQQLLGEKDPSAHAAELIGSFGVGFYSAFMVADQVTLRTRKAGGCAAVEWESTGDGTYLIRECEKQDRGTTITLHLRPVDSDNGIPDFTDDCRLSSIVKKHSDFITYPIMLERQRQNGNDPKQITIEDCTINSMKPLWKRRSTEVSPEEYVEFYKHISHDFADPLRTIHFRAEGTSEYDALLFIPANAAYDLYRYGAKTTGLRLYAKRVMIMERCEDLIPEYLRFVQGVVDVFDLPLNISRQRLQQDHHITRIRKRLTTKVLDSLTELWEKERDQYLKVWKEFGRAIKEGVSSDYENKQRLLPLLLYPSSNAPEKLTSLMEYVSRMQPEQNHIFYLTGESRSQIENSPHLEAIREKGYEVLYMTEGVDELVMQHLFEYEGKKLKSAGKGAVELGSESERAEVQKQLESKQEEFKSLIEFLQKTLEEHVKQVRLSTRLKTSPACLVVEDHEFSPMLERALNRGIAGSKPRRVLEINPNHDLISKMRSRVAANAEDPCLANAAKVLHGVAVLSEGSQLTDAAPFNRAATQILCQAL